MSRFDAVIKDVAEYEGGWSYNPKDPGGATMKGITLATYSGWIGRQATKAELKAISDETAKAIYYKNYWLASKCDSLPAGLDRAVMDAAVNSGTGRAAKWLQAAVGVKKDGAIGPITIEAVKKYPVKGLINSVMDQRLAFMKVAKNPQTGALLWPTFKNGWQKRIDSVRAKSLADAAASAPEVSKSLMSVVLDVLKALFGGR